jgi:peptidyl-prolyl cis-trans isomerase D|tara:strand:+ start:568 stop:2025 length:1458 start_codon:yes stop_codon:yes gene_type:complete
MLTSIGKYSKGFFVKLLVGIIILPFVFWGMGDVFRGGNQNIIATIDSNKVSTQEFVNYLNRLNLSEKERKDLSKSNLLERILSDYVGKKIVELEFEKLGVHISDESLKDIIINDKIFFKDGVFSRTKYEKFLLESSLSAPQFEQNIAQQIKRMQLLSYLSDGSQIPEFLIENEFKKENQKKIISFIDLNNFYKKRNPEAKEIKKLYDENKKLFTKEYKVINLIELKPENLIGNIEYSDAFFKKIDEIENKILDGDKIENILSVYENLKLISSAQIDKKKLDFKGNKKIDMDDQLFNKIFTMKKVKTPEIIILNDKYFLGEVKSIHKKQIPLEDKDLQNSIKTQLIINDKLENNTKIAKDLSNNLYGFKQMKKFANDNAIEIEKTAITSLKDNDIFKENIIKRIFILNDGEIGLITDSTLTKNYLIHADKTIYSSLDKKSKKYLEYRSKAKVKFANKIYSTYDSGINNKYKIELNDKVVTRIKNSY